MATGVSPSLLDAMVHALNSTTGHACTWLCDEHSSCRVVPSLCTQAVSGPSRNLVLSVSVVAGWCRQGGHDGHVSDAESTVP